MAARCGLLALVISDQEAERSELTARTDVPVGGLIHYVHLPIIQCWANHRNVTVDELNGADGRLGLVFYGL